MAAPGRLPRSAAPAFALTHREQATLLELIQALLSVNTEQEFMAWLTGPLQNLLPHGMMICGLAEIHPQDVQIQKVITYNWPLAYFEALKRPEGGFYSPIMARWNERHLPQLYDPESDRGVTHRLWLDVFRDFRLDNIAAHGMHDLSGSLTSYFNFSRVPEVLSERHAYLLELLTPHMHGALIRALVGAAHFTPRSDEPPLQVTDRERSILHWMLEGKTNWEIAHISGRSEHTIKNQVAHILTKLQATNRAQAVAKAIGLQLIR